MDEYDTIRQNARDQQRATFRALKDEYRAYRLETRGMEKDARREARRAEKDRLAAKGEELERAADDEQIEALTALMSAFEDMAQLEAEGMLTVDTELERERRQQVKKVERRLRKLEYARYKE